MKKLNVIKEQQEQYIKECEFKTKRFLKSISLQSIEFILLSGSVARGDYMPGKYGGMIDLTVVKSKGITLDADEIFGIDEEPDIPYHCVYHLGQGFQIAILDHLELSDFQDFNEPQKYAFLESKVLYEKENNYIKLKNEINNGIDDDLRLKKNECLGYINYLLSGYKTDRWLVREAYPQLHSNLNKAIEMALKCIYYNNGKYSPAEDRILYYSYSLPKTINSFDKMIHELYKQDIMSHKDYIRREEIFLKIMLPMI